jgi:hypothetical protein
MSGIERWVGLWYPPYPPAENGDGPPFRRFEDGLENLYLAGGSETGLRAAPVHPNRPRLTVRQPLALAVNQDSQANWSRSGERIGSKGLWIGRDDDPVWSQIARVKYPARRLVLDLFLDRSVAIGTPWPASYFWHPSLTGHPNITGTSVCLGRLGCRCWAWAWAWRIRPCGRVTGR